MRYQELGIKDLYRGSLKLIELSRTWNKRNQMGVCYIDLEK
jgi:hypothetical protein